MGHRRKVTLVWAFGLFLALVSLQTAFPLVPPLARLRGFVPRAQPVKWDLQSIVTGETKRRAEAWFSDHIGFRELWVSLDNQVSYTFFGETRQRGERSATQIVVGPHDWLFERQYVDTALRPVSFDLPRIEAGVAHLKSVQAKLARRGIPLVLIVAPSKAELYPEHIPASVLRERSPDRVTTIFEKTREALKTHGVPFYDGPQRFADWKAAGQRNLFARSGSHWSYVAALQVLEDLRNELNPRMKRPIPEFIVGDTSFGPPRGIDADLIDLANLLVGGPYKHELPYPTLVPQQAVPVEQLPRILWVHDSFGWVLHDLMFAANAEQPTEALYYYRTAVGMPGRRLLDLDPAAARWTPATGPETLDQPNPRLKKSLAEADWQRLIASYDAVVIVWTEIAAYDFSWGFLEQLDRALD